MARAVRNRARLRARRRRRGTDTLAELPARAALRGGSGRALRRQPRRDPFAGAAARLAAVRRAARRLACLLRFARWELGARALAGLSRPPLSQHRSPPGSASGFVAGIRPRASASPSAADDRGPNGLAAVPAAH